MAEKIFLKSKFFQHFPLLKTTFFKHLHMLAFDFIIPEEYSCLTVSKNSFLKLLNPLLSFGY